MASQQSWSDWLWDTYTSVFGTNTTQAGSDSTTSETSSKPITTSSSPYGPYVRTGRGGAGNFTWQSQTSSIPSEYNLEAQPPVTLKEQQQNAATVEHLDTDAALKTQATSKPAPQYVRVGRGFVEVSQIPQVQASEAGTNMPVLNTSSTPNVAHPGRGGAGNYAAAMDLNLHIEEEKRKQEGIKAKEARSKAEKEVQSILAFPAGAHISAMKQNPDS